MGIWHSPSPSQPGPPGNRICEIRDGPSVLYSQIEWKVFIPFICVASIRDIAVGAFTEIWTRMKTDLEIAHAASLQPIGEIAARLGLTESDIELYGRYKAKIPLDILKRTDVTSKARYVIVTAITPTKLGEGKTTTTIGLSQALAKIGKSVAAAIRQPSQGPTFGIKGGGAGGGYSQAVPLEDINLHLTGDIHAVAAAHNLLAAAIDARIYHEARVKDERLEKLKLRRLDIDVESVTWKRALDVNDRALRSVELSDDNGDSIRETGFDITAASEVMAILALATDIHDLRQRLGRIVIGQSTSRREVTAEDLGVAGAMTVLLKDAINPNLVQTLEGVPTFVHAGPFANIAHGNSSIVADRVALSLLDEDGYLVTEAGFGADCGFEKFCDVKCRYSGLTPDCAVVVATIRALKLHGGGPPPGARQRKLDEAQSLDFLAKGLENLKAILHIVARFGVPAVVAVNRFTDDTDEEVEMVVQAALEAGAHAAVGCELWAKGGSGGTNLARAVDEACDRGSDFRFLYDLEDSIRDKIDSIATGIYGAANVEFAPLASEQIKRFTEQGYGQLPVIMAKTPLSLSHDPKLIGAPKGFTLPVREVRLSAGAGFLYALCGDIFTMPGLGSKPAFMRIDIDEAGEVVGLS